MPARHTQQRRRELTATKLKRYTVTQGISPKPGAPWFVAEVKPNGNMRRVSSKHLPLRATREEAENDLLKWIWRQRTGNVARMTMSFTEWLSRDREYVQGIVLGIDVERFLD